MKLFLDNSKDSKMTLFIGILFTVAIIALIIIGIIVPNS